MNKVRKFVKIFTLFLLLNEGKCRRYDIDNESKKLYEEDFKSVLKRFRRTPEYLKILNDKMADLTEYVQDLGLQMMYFYDNKMKEKIKETLHVEQETTTWNGLDAMRMQNPLDHYSMSRLNPNHIYNSIQTHKAQREGNLTENNNPVKSLDNYHLLRSRLTLQERNTFRDMGFEYAGLIIQSVIKSLSNEEPFDRTVRSTRQLLVTTTHYPTFTTTTPSSVFDVTFDQYTSTLAELNPTDKGTFRFKYRAPKLSRYE